MWFLNAHGASFQCYVHVERKLPIQTTPGGSIGDVASISGGRALLEEPGNTVYNMGKNGVSNYWKMIFFIAKISSCQ